jgi:hypothetical protein
MSGGTVRLSPLLTTDTDEVLSLIGAGKAVPKGRGYVLANLADPLAWGEKNVEVVDLLKSKGASVEIDLNRDPNVKQHILGYNFDVYGSRFEKALASVFQDSTP